MRRIALSLLGCLMLAATGCCCNKSLCGGMSGCDPCGSWDPCGSSCTSGGLFGSACDSCGSMDCCGASLGCGTTVGCGQTSFSPSCAAPSCAAPYSTPAYSAMPSNCPECAAPAPTTYRGAYLQPQLQTSQAAPQVVHAPVTYDTSWQTMPASTPSNLNEPAALPAVPAY